MMCGDEGGRRCRVQREVYNKKRRYRPVVYKTGDGELHISTPVWRNAVAQVQKWCERREGAYVKLWWAVCANMDLGPWQ